MPIPAPIVAACLINAFRYPGGRTLEEAISPILTSPKALKKP
jgi:hypothetical protein